MTDRDKKERAACRTTRGAIHRRSALKIQAIVGLLHLLGLVLLTDEVWAASVPPAGSVEAAKACKAFWSAKVWSAKGQNTGATDVKSGPPRATFGRPSPSLLCMRGAFWFDTTRRIQEIADPAAIKTLVITSDGGVPEPAIDLAKVAERHHWLIVFEERCFSSCANYVFLSRTEKVLLPQSMLGWHGLPPEPDEVNVSAFQKWQEGMPPSWPRFDYDTAISYLKHSKDFLAERNIPPALCRSRPQVGHSKDYVARLNSLALSGADPLWSYGREALEKKFNVTGIVYMWEPDTPDAGTEFALKTYRTNLFYFDLSRR